MRTVILTILLTITNYCFSQTRVDIDTVLFRVGVTEKIDTVRTFEMTIQTDKVYPYMNYQVHRTITKDGNQIFYRLDSVTKPQILLCQTGRATNKFDLGKLSDCTIQFYLIRGKDTSFILLKVTEQEYSLKNVGDDFVINTEVTKNRIPQHYIWGVIGFMDKEDTTVANEYVKDLIKAGAKFKKLKPGNYLEFIVSDNHDIFPSSGHGHYHDKMYALYYSGDFQKVRQLMKSYRDKKRKGKQFSVTLQDDKGNSSSTWTN